MTREQLIKELLTDHLTGLANRRAWDEQSVGAPIVAALDLDGLKWANDHLGHGAGDAMLQEVARTARSLGITLYRIGGDEFAAQFRNGVEAVAALTTLQATLARSQWTYQGRDERTHRRRGVGISFGWAPTQALADHALLEQKAARRVKRGQQVPLQAPSRPFSWILGVPR